LVHDIYKLHNTCPDAIKAIHVDYLSPPHSPDTQGSTFTITSVAAAIYVPTQATYLVRLLPVPCPAAMPWQVEYPCGQEICARWVILEETWRSLGAFPNKNLEHLGRTITTSNTLRTHLNTSQFNKIGIGILKRDPCRYGTTEL
jgi:hypothetical protein